MPLYEYQCQNCNYQFDIIQKMSDEKLILCPKCGQHKLKKLISSSGFRLKGSGWYETDFKTKKIDQVKKTDQVKKIDK